MVLETDEQIIARKTRDRAVKKAWREWKKRDRLAAKLAPTLPTANPTPKPIIATHNLRGRDTIRWKSWGH